MLVGAGLRQILATFMEVWQPWGLVVGRHLFAGVLVITLLSWADFAEARTGRQVHVVYPGQRLGSIAKRYNVSVEVICQVNGIDRPDRIKPGQRLEIPSRAEARKLAEQAKGATATPTDAAATPADTAQPVKAAPKAAVAGAAAKANQPGHNKAESNKSAKAESKSSAKPEVTLAKTQTPGAAKAAALDTASKTADVKASSVKRGTTRLDPVTMLPTGLAHRVKSGDSLSGIAVRYDTTVKALLEANNLRRDQVIRVGQVLTIPQAPVGSGWWAKFAKKPQRSGEIEVFAHHAHSVRWKGKAVVNGKVQPAARTALSRLLGATGSAPPVPDRLLQLLVHVSDTFGGRPIRLVSGYRISSYVKDSRHRHSSAVDFSIPGVPNAALRDYLLQLGNVGVGYYPNSSFVHLDVRGRSAYWVDYAGPGEAPRKTPRGDLRVAEASTKTERKPATAVASLRSVAATTPTAPTVTELDVLGERTVAAIEGRNTPSTGLLKRPTLTEGTLGAGGANPVNAAERGVAVSKSVAVAEAELMTSVPKVKAKSTDVKRTDSSDNGG